jgi:hypothetical protein
MLQVKGYPTLKLFKNGKATEYKGGRTEDTIISYMRKATGPPAKEFDSADATQKFIDGSKVGSVVNHTLFRLLICLLSTC